MKIFLFLLLLVIAAVVGYFVLDTSGTERNPYTFVPTDFIYAIESDRPVQDWQGLSKTAIWSFLKGTEYFAEISESADYLDELLQENQTLTRLVRLGDLLISAHMISREDYDFVYIVDLKLSKVAKFREVLNLVFRSLEYEVGIDAYFGIDIFDLYDPQENETLSIAILDNVLVASYNKPLLKKAIAQTESAGVLDDPEFSFVRERTDPEDLYTIFINYRFLNQMIGAYTQEMPELLAGLDEILSFSSLNFNMEDEEISFNGYMKQLDSVPSFLSVFKDVSKGKIRAPQVLPRNTAMYTSIGFDNFLDFYRRLETYYKQQNLDEYEDLNDQKRKIERLLKISFEDQFFSWMTDEVATAIIPVDSQYSAYEYYALLHFSNYEKAKQEMDFLSAQVKRRTPVKFEAIEYQGFEIRYLELKGFFKLFFKKLFSNIERPHYTFLDDFVVFSNDTTALKSLIDTYLSQEVLRNSDEYADFIRNFDSQSNIFTYLNNQHLFNYILSTLDPEARKDFRTKEMYVKSFPHVGFQVVPAYGMYKTYMMADFVPPIEAEK